MPRTADPEGALATSLIDRRHRGRGCPAEASLNSPHRNQQRRSFRYSNFTPHMETPDDRQHHRQH